MPKLRPLLFPLPPAPQALRLPCAQGVRNVAKDAHP